MARTFCIIIHDYYIVTDGWAAGREVKSVNTLIGTNQSLAWMLRDYRLYFPDHLTFTVGVF